jgi:hypothetical protein
MMHKAWLRVSTILVSSFPNHDHDLLLLMD